MRYDVKVGGAGVEELDPNDDLGVMCAELLQKRIDAIGIDGETWWVVEVKPVGSMSALGQVLTYVDLVKAESPAGVLVRPAIVCERVDPDVVGALTSCGVWVFSVGSEMDGPPRLVEVVAG